MKIYRLQSKSGKGPLEYYPELLDLDLTTKQLQEYLALVRIPDKYSELDSKLEWSKPVQKLLQEGKALFGTRTLQQLKSWFPDNVLNKLKKYGMRVVELEVPKDNVFTSKSGKQIVFLKPQAMAMSNTKATETKKNFQDIFKQLRSKGIEVLALESICTALHERGATALANELAAWCSAHLGK